MLDTPMPILMGSIWLGNDRFLYRNVAGYLWDATARNPVHPGIARSEKNQSPLAGVAELIRLFGFEHNGVVLLEHEFFMRRAHGALTLENHKNMIVVFVVVHIVLNAGL